MLTNHTGLYTRVVLYIRVVLYTRAVLYTSVVLYTRVVSYTRVILYTRVVLYTRVDNGDRTRWLRCRWLRFPCCGMRFPCDLCHEELTDGHEMKWAKRMVCGYCSLEQPVDSRCTNCDRKLAATARNPEGAFVCAGCASVTFLNCH